MAGAKAQSAERGRTRYHAGVSGNSEHPEPVDNPSVRAAALEAEDLAEVAAHTRKVSAGRVRLGNDIQRFVDAQREAGYLDEEDTGVHHLDLVAERQAFTERVRRVEEQAVETLRERAALGAGPTTLRPAELVRELGRPRDEHVLVIDGDPGVATEAEHALRDEGYQVRSANSGLDGLTKILRGVTPPDVLVISMALPELSGRGLLEALRETPMANLPRVVVLVDGSGAECTVRDADIVHRQPLDKAALVEAVRIKVGERRASGA